jgi:heme-degrading monooxygenase HmoA
MAERDSYLAQVPGFVAFHLLRGPEHEDYTLYSSHTMWASQQAFSAWTQSEQFRAAHRDAGSRKPLHLGHPKFEGFEVVQALKRLPSTLNRAALEFPLSRGWQSGSSWLDSALEGSRW